MKKLSLCVIVLCLILSFTVTTSAAPIKFEDNYYEFYSGYVSWEVARDNAYSSMLEIDGTTYYGYLVTITSTEENEFLRDHFNNGSFWAGGEQTPHNSSPSPSNWTWITGEEWTIAPWSGGEPNDSGGSEYYLEVFDNGQWNDEHNYSGSVNGYMVEYRPVPISSSLVLLFSGMFGIIGLRRRALRARMAIIH